MTSTISSKEVSLEIGKGRHVGVDTQEEHHKFLAPLSETFITIAKHFKEKSALLAIKDHNTVSREAVIEAFKHDVSVCNAAITDFETFIHSSIKCSIITKSSGTDSATAGKLSDITWGIVKATLPDIGKVPVVTLNHIRAAKKPAEMLYELQEQYLEGVQTMVQRFSFYIHKMVEMDYSGVVEWTADDVCRYHYFQHRTERNASIIKEFAEKVEGKPGFFEQKQEVIAHYNTFNERHVHTLINAQKKPIEELKGLFAPEEITNFVLAAPVWIKPHLGVVVGDLVQVEKITKSTEQSTAIEIESLYMFDPAITLGDFSLAGFIPKEQGIAAESEDDFNWKLLALIVITVIGGIWWVINWYVDKTNKDDHQSYIQYVHAAETAPYSGKVYIVHNFEPLVLPEGYKHVRILLGGAFPKGSHIANRFNVLGPDSSYLQSFEMYKNSSIDSTYYGDVQIPLAITLQREPTPLEINQYEPVTLSVIGTGQGWIKYRLK